MKDLPVIGITMGDPSGIGPEIIIKAFSDAELYKICNPVILGDPGALLEGMKGRKKNFIKVILNPSDAEARPGQVDVMAISRLKRGMIIPGKPRIEGGKAMVEYIIKAVEMARQGEIAAMVTCPISKALMHKAGYSFDGHTQLISHLTNTEDYVMMLAGQKLRVSLIPYIVPSGMSLSAWMSRRFTRPYP